MKNKILATLLTLGFIGLVVLFFWLCMNVEYFGLVVFVLFAAGGLLFCVGVLLRILWSVIYDSLKGGG